MPDEINIRRLPRRTAEVTLPAPYDDFHVTVWVNFPPSLRQKLFSSDLDQVAEAFGQLVVSHDLVDFDGEPLPANGADLYRAMPEELVPVIWRAALNEVGRLPK